MESVIYFDNNATTQTDTRVINRMLPYFNRFYGNPSSTHAFGKSIQHEIDACKSEVASFLNISSPGDLIFTSGATEAINLALKGIALKNGAGHIITSSTEHKAVLETCEYLEQIGFEVTYLPVNSSGLIDPKSIQQAIQPNTILVSIMWVNNETGIIQPIKEIVQVCQKSSIPFFCDATQACGKINIDLSDVPVDVLAFSAHKFYGPKGIGCLYIKDLKENRHRYSPIIHGGQHQSNLRSGTYNVPAIIGLAEACKIAHDELDTDISRITSLRDSLEKVLLQFPGSFINGSKEYRVCNVINICFPGIDAGVLIGQLKHISVSNGSACTSALVEPSHVLTAMGLKQDDAFSTIRFSLGRFNTKEEISSTASYITDLFSKILQQHA